MHAYIESCTYTQYFSREGGQGSLFELDFFFVGSAYTCVVELQLWWTKESARGRIDLVNCTVQFKGILEIPHICRGILDIPDVIPRPHHLFVVSFLHPAL